MVDRRMTGRIVKLEERRGGYPWRHLTGYTRDPKRMTDAELAAERTEIAGQDPSSERFQ